MPIAMISSMPFLADTGDDVNENSIVVMLRGDTPLVARKRLFERLLGDR